MNSSHDSSQGMDSSAVSACSEWKKALDGHISLVISLVALGEDINKAADMLGTCLENGGRLLFCGNGGSAADAQHLAAEFTGRFLFDRRPLDAMALHTNTSALTAIGNDYGYEHTFSRQVLAHGRKGDVLIGISTSGSSPNVLEAMRAARSLGMRCLTLTGEAPNPMAELADVCLPVAAQCTPRIQEMHILIGHTLCEIVEKRLCSPA